MISTTPPVSYYITETLDKPKFLNLYMIHYSSQKHFMPRLFDYISVWDLCVWCFFALSWVTRVTCMIVCFVSSLYFMWWTIIIYVKRKWIIFLKCVARAPSRQRKAIIILCFFFFFFFFFFIIFLFCQIYKINFFVK